MTPTPPSRCAGCGAVHWRRSNRCWECLERELVPFMFTPEPEQYATDKLGGVYVDEFRDVLSALVAKEEANLGKDYDE